MKNLFIILVLLYLHFGYGQSDANDWGNEQVPQINKEAPYASLFYDDASKNVTLLNGQWDFAWYKDVSKISRDVILLI